MSGFDAIVVGAGHNGLVAGAYLAKAGRRVLILEGRPQVGGAAVTEELFPGFRISSVADGCGYLSPEVARDLKLESHGLAVLPSDLVVWAPQPDGNALAIWRDPGRTAQEISRFSQRDAARWPDFVALMQKLAGVVAGMARITPPDLPELSWSDLPKLAELAGPVRRLGRRHVSDLLRVLPMPVADLLNEWCESDALKGALAAGGVRDITWGPQEAGTAWTFLYHWALSDTGLFRSASTVKGVIGALTAALAASARSFGAEIRTDARVAEISVSDGAVTGIGLASGEEIGAPLVISNADPRTTFLELVDATALPQAFVTSVRHLKYRGSAARIHLALSGLPRFTAAAGADPAQVLRGAIQIAPSVLYLQKAHDFVKYGEASPQPYLDLRIPTLSDPGLAPAGQHLMSITAKFAPYRLRGATWAERREPFTEVVLDTLEEYAPGLRGLVLRRATLSPADLESRYGLPEGNGHHGEMTLDQFFHMRPIPGYAAYGSPIAGLFLCGAGAHPGGGVTGVPGRNAAREILRRRA
jgi:phytoene dehydrogenase-like protein